MRESNAAPEWLSAPSYNERYEDSRGVKIPDAGPAPVTDLHAADWVVDELTGTTLTVGSLLPTRFDHCARILHPAQKTSEADPRQAEWVSWTEVATANGRVIHSQVQFKAIVGS